VISQSHQDEQQRLGPHFPGGSVVACYISIVLPVWHASLVPLVRLCTRSPSEAGSSAEALGTVAIAARTATRLPKTLILATIREQVVKAKALRRNTAVVPALFLVQESVDVGSTAGVPLTAGWIEQAYCMDAEDLCRQQQITVSDGRELPPSEELETPPGARSRRDFTTCKEREHLNCKKTPKSVLIYSFLTESS
jgi:hypothetical protein